jgi:hypothetical protein
MNTFKKLALALLLAVPMALSADGMGVYIPISADDRGSVTLDYDSDLIPNRDVDIDYKAAAGLGMAFDSNIGQDKLFNYRLGLEVLKQKFEKVDGSSCTGDCDFGTRINMVHTFGFGLLRTQTVRLWIGPRINMAYEWDTGDNGYSRFGFEFGVAPAVGVNVNLGRVVSLAADLDYRFASTAGAWDSDLPFDGGSYSGKKRGTTARFYVLFRFGEHFDQSADVSQEQSVIDQSL